MWNKKKKTLGHAMEGQVLFAAVEGDSLILDCILTRAGWQEAGVPVTLKARLPQGTQETAVSKLNRWAEEGSFIEVVVSPGADGNQLAISRSTSTVVLDPYA